MFHIHTEYGWYAGYCKTTLSFTKNFARAVSYEYNSQAIFIANWLAGVMGYEGVCVIATIPVGLIK